MRDWDVPPQNVIYADRDGNIGYIMAGAIPLRAHGQGLLPSPGWTGEYEWIGFIPFEDLPQLYNPEQHFIITANNRVVDDSYPYYITNEWLNGYRAQRIRDLLTRKGTLTLADMATIQADQYAIPAVEIVPYLLQVQTTTPLEKEAQRIVRNWDYVLAPNSIGAAIYSTFLRKLERIVLNTRLGDDEALFYSYLGVGANALVPLNGYVSRSRPLLIRLLKQHDDTWFANSAVPNGPQSWNAALAAAFHATIGELRDRFGDDISRWRYRALHELTYVHPLGSIKPLSRFFNRGPFPFGGDIDTVNTGVTSPDKPEVVTTVPSYRQIVDLGNMNNSLSGHAPGQSGHPTSKHYDDFIPMWLHVQHHPMLFERQTIEANAEGTLHLIPEM
jgi:penicillin amidase